MAILAAAAWFILRSEYRETIQIESLLIQAVCLDKEKAVLLVNVGIRNVGTVTVRPRLSTTNVRLLSPQPISLDYDVDQRGATMPIINQIETDMNAVTLYPGELHTHPEILLVDRTAEVILVESYVELEKKENADAREISIWANQTLFKFEKVDECGLADDEINILSTH